MCTALDVPPLAYPHPRTKQLIPVSIIGDPAQRGPQINDGHISKRTGETTSSAQRISYLAAPVLIGMLAFVLCSELSLGSCAPGQAIDGNRADSARWQEGVRTQHSAGGAHCIPRDPTQRGAARLLFGQLLDGTQAIVAALRVVLPARRNGGESNDPL